MLLLMLAAVEFYDELCGVALEVGDVRPDGALPPEFEARKLAGPEVTPQQIFGVGGVSSEASCSGDGGWVSPSLK